MRHVSRIPLLAVFLSALPLAAPAQPKQLAVLEGHTNPVLSLAFSPDGKTLASGGGATKKPGQLKWWDVATGKELASLNTLPVSSVAFSPDGKTLASGGLDKLVRLWDTATVKERGSLQGHTGAVSCVAFSPDGKTLASGGGGLMKDGELMLWDVVTGKNLANLRGHTTAISSVAFSPDGKTLASGGGTKPGGNLGGTAGELKLWDVATGKELARFQGLKGVVRSVAFSPDGKTLASASGGGGGKQQQPGELKLWDMNTGAERASHPTGTMSAVAFSPDGRTLLSGGQALAKQPAELKLFDVATGKELTNLQGLKIPVTAVAFSPAVSTFASASGGPFGSPARITLWELKPAK